MGARNSTRERMITSATVLLSERGVAGTSVAKVLEHSNGPRGSVGFHFPGGRSELLTDALVTVGDTVTAILHHGVRNGHNPVDVFTGICSHYRDQLTATSFTAGCPIGAAMQEAHHDVALEPVIGGIVRDWQTALANLLVNAGHADGDAHALSMLAISSMEGAITMSRVTRSPDPIDSVIAHVAPLLSPAQPRHRRPAVTDDATSDS